ncbi:Cullin [Sporodiniella umbellata]|nr:Cullin [Sporodiniella umbellata]
MDAIRERKPFVESQEVLFQICENLCQSEKAQELLDLLYTMCTSMVQDHFHKLHRYVDTQGGSYLEKSNTIWKEYSEQISILCSLFLYLDRSFIISVKGKSIWSIAMELFRQRFLKDDAIRSKTFDSIFELIQLERTLALPVNQDLQLSIRMLLELGLYQDFESGFLDKTREFYQNEGDVLMNTMSMGDYLNNVSTRVHQESIKNVKQYYDRSTKAPLQAIVEEELLAKRVIHILDKGFHHFLEKYLVDELSLLYRLLKRVGKLDSCADYFKQSVKDKGSEILCGNLSVQEKMNTLLTFKKKSEYIVNHSFEGDERFVNGLNEGLEYIVNLRENNTLKTLAKHIDSMIKLDRMDEKYVELFMFLFRHLQAKDEFEMVYKRDMAKRLLLNNTTHRGHEKALLFKLKKECGLPYTSKLEGMLRDIKQSAELMSEFNTMEDRFRANVLTPGFWPTFALVRVKIPPELESLQDVYTHLYIRKYPRRQLTWQNTLGTCDAVAHYPKGSKHVTFTLLQTLVLLLFNTNDSLLFTDILKVTQLACR